MKSLEEALFRKWKNKYHGSLVVPDGVVDEDSYDAAKNKILFLLKEVNDWKDKDRKLRDLLLNNPYWRTWNNAARWAYGLLKAPQFIPWNSELDNVNKEFREKWLKHVVVMNMKKISGVSRSVWGELSDFVRDNREELREQLSFYNPDITVCCGTGCLLYELLRPEGISWKISSNKTRYSTTKALGIIIDYYHPQASISKSILYTNLMESVCEVMSQPDANKSL